MTLKIVIKKEYNTYIHRQTPTPLFWYNQKSKGVTEFSMFRGREPLLGGWCFPGVDFILYIISCVDYNYLLMFYINMRRELQGRRRGFNIGGA